MSGANKVLTPLQRCRHNVDMTSHRNSNVVSTVWLEDGTQVSFSHRDTLRGWVNGLKRRGVDPSQVVNGCPGLPDSDRV